MIEDEIHFICVCSLYNKLRNSLFEGIPLDYSQFANLCTKDKFIYLMIYNRDRYPNIPGKLFVSVGIFCIIDLYTS